MSGMIERAREATQQLADVAREHTENVRASVADMDLSAASAEKIQELLAAVDTAIPFVREAGYELVRAFVELGPPPRLVVGAHPGAGDQ
jgi:hypothetical protein